MLQLQLRSCRCDSLRLRELRYATLLKTPKPSSVQVAKGSIQDSATSNYVLSGVS